MTSRLHSLDNLRTFMIFFVVLYHSAIVFQPGWDDNWLVVNPTKSNTIGLLGLYIDTFVMFIIFFISGYFIPASLKRKTTVEFLISKVNRIAIPWLVAVLTLIPLYKILFLYSRGLPQEVWYSYFHFFHRAGADLGYFANNPTQHWLWFLPILLLFQVLYMAMSKTKLLSVTISFKSAVVLTFVIGLIYSKIMSGLGLRGWVHTWLIDFQMERLLVYFMVFLLGSLCYKLNLFNPYKRHLKYYILANVVMALAITVYTLTALNLFFNLVEPERNYFYISRQVDVIAFYSSLLLTMLTMVYLITDMFLIYINKAGKLMSQMNEDSYYVYIIHMIVVGGIALLLVPLKLPIYIKFPMLAILGFTISHWMVFASRRILKKLRRPSASDIRTRINDIRF